MRDIFFTIVAVYVVWRILGEFAAAKNKNNNSDPKINYNNKRNSSKNNNNDEYVDYEEVK